MCPVKALSLLIIALLSSRTCAEALFDPVPYTTNQLKQPLRPAELELALQQISDLQRQILKDKLQAEETIRNYKKLITQTAIIHDQRAHTTALAGIRGYLTKEYGAEKAFELSLHPIPRWIDGMSKESIDLKAYLSDLAVMWAETKYQPRVSFWQGELLWIRGDGLVSKQSLSEMRSHFQHVVQSAQSPPNLRAAARLRQISILVVTRDLKKATLLLQQVKTAPIVKESQAFQQLMESVRIALDRGIEGAWEYGPHSGNY